MTTCLCVTGTPASWQTSLHALVKPAQVTSVLPTHGTPLDRAVEVLSVVLYRPDPPDCDQWCDPSTTLASRQGDCDDMVILGLSCLATAGLWALMVVGVYGSGSAPNHVWIEGNDTQGWFLFETTNGEVHRGARPSGYTPMYMLDPRNTEPVQTPLQQLPSSSVDVTGLLVVGAAVTAAAALILTGSVPTQTS